MRETSYFVRLLQHHRWHGGMNGRAEASPYQSSTVSGCDPPAAYVPGPLLRGCRGGIRCLFDFPQGAIFAP